MNNRLIIFISLIFAAALLLILTIFPEMGTEKMVQSKPIPVILKANTSHPYDFWSVVKRGVREAAKEYEIDFYITGPRFEKDIAMQMTILDQIISRKPPLIILAASEYEKLVDLVEKADKAGIPVITVDSGVDSDIPITFISTDNREAGRKAGYALSKRLNDSSLKKYALMSYIKGTDTAMERELGVRESAGDLEYTETLYCEGDQDLSYSLTLDLLKRSTDLGGIIALNEPSSLGVAQAVDELGLKDKIAVVGFDNAPREMHYLEQGIMKALVIQRPFNMGYLAMKTAYNYLTGEDVPDFINTGSLLITRENMYHQELQEVLFPFGD